MTPAEQYFRDTLAQIAKEAQQDAYRAAFRLEEYERRHGFHRPGTVKMGETVVHTAPVRFMVHAYNGDPETGVSSFSSARLNPEQAYAEVTGRTTYAGAENTAALDAYWDAKTPSEERAALNALAGAETMTRRNAEDIHD